VVLALVVALAGGAATPAADGLRALAARPEVRMALEPSAKAGTIEVVGLPPASLRRLRGAAWDSRTWTAAFAVRTEAAAKEGALPAVLGAYSVEDDRVRFTPRFPLVPGHPYDVRLAVDRLVAAGEAPAPLPPTLQARLFLPRPLHFPRTIVEAVYPTAEVVPANLLKLYVVFSGPMRPGSARDKVRLVEADTGRVVENAFAAGGVELWDPERRRLTLIFDPGRIKQGLADNLALGPPLREGARYRLEVDASFKDAEGEPLVGGFVRELRVGPPDRVAPDPAGWQVEAPAEGTREPLRIVFPEPYDRALLERALAVVGADGRRVAGRATLHDAERRWSFVPDAPWRPGHHDVRVDPLLEDLAGNNLRRLFDRDEGASSPAMPRESISFDPRPRTRSRS
jgi:hypothetical protein